MRPDKLFSWRRSLCAAALAAGLTSCQAAPSVGADTTTVSIFMNQTGFEAGAAQRATVRSDTEMPIDWQVIDASGRTVSSGITSAFGKSEASGDAVHQIEISPPLPVGQSYTLLVDGARSRAFDVRDAPYTQVAEDALTYFYLNRAGTPVEAAHAPGPQWARAAGHTRETVTCFTGEDRTGLKWPGCRYTLDVTGGWYDAGDFGKYAVNGGISAWRLQNAAERLLYRGESGAKWADGRVSLPENGNGVSEILDEARWEVEFLMAMQVPEGARLALPKGVQSVRDGQRLVLSEVDAGGLVHHKVHEARWLGLPLKPEDALETRHLIPPSTAATLNMVAAAAQASRLWRGVDDAFAARALEAATRGYDAALRHPDIFSYNVFDGGGPYTDTDVSDEFAWAATELYATTGDASYLANLAQTPGAAWLVRARESQLKDLSWPDVDQLPAATMLSAQPSFSDADRERAGALLLASAERYLNDAAQDGYGAPYPPSGYGWGSNGAMAGRGLALGYAFDLTGDAKYRNGMVAVLDYLHGRNPLDQSYVAGYGAKSVRHVHHRFWAEGADPAYPPAAPGALSGGPNAGYPTSDYETAVIGPCAPQTCWLDDHTAFSLNEVAINWNSSLFWLTSYLDTTPPRS
ncbi:MAG: glycoside hydrolase family 9 protein [Pseudomonadota bacterium]